MSSKTSNPLNVSDKDITVTSINPAERQEKMARIKDILARQEAQ